MSIRACIKQDAFWDMFPAHTYLVIDPILTDSDVLDLDTERGRIVASSLPEAGVLLLRGVDRGSYPSGCLLVEFISEEEEIELTDSDLEIISL